LNLFFLIIAKTQKCFPLAPVEVKTLISWGSAYKVEAQNGTMFPEKPNHSASKKQLKP